MMMVRVDAHERENTYDAPCVAREVTLNVVENEVRRLQCFLAKRKLLARVLVGQQVAMEMIISLGTFPSRNMTTYFEMSTNIPCSCVSR
jgi:hypothetical protein